MTTPVFTEPTTTTEDGPTNDTESLPTPQARPIHELPGVVMPYLDLPCERNRKYPCLHRRPNPADFMIRLAECDCEYEDEEDNASPDVQATCGECLELLLEQKEAVCMGCGTRWVPGHELVVDIVKIRFLG